MKIEHIEVIEMEMPFDKGISKKDQVGFLNWGKLDFCLVKVETSSGITGWGDAFSFQCRRPVAEALKHMVIPRVIGKDAHWMWLISIANFSRRFTYLVATVLRCLLYLAWI